jgi:hypothetical protein
MKSMTIYQVMQESPWLTFFLLLGVLKLFSWPFEIVYRWIRHLDIKAQGWPPAHCDADGDAVEENEDE